MQIRVLTAASAAVALALSQSASAIEEVGQAYIAPMATYINPDGDRDRLSVDGDNQSEFELCSLPGCPSRSAQSRCPRCAVPACAR